MRSGLQGICHLPMYKDSYWKYCCQVLGYECITKNAIYEKIGYHPLAKLEEVHNDRSLNRVILAANRVGKTYFAAHEALPYLMFMGANGWYVSASYDLAEEFYRKLENILVNKLGLIRVLRNDNLEFWEFTYSPKTHVLNMGTGSSLQLKSAESPNSMHSVPLDYVIIDEASLIPFVIYDTRLVPRLADNGGWILSIGTPEDYDSTGEWFSAYADIGQMPNEYSIKSWTLKLEDNQFKYTAIGGETSQKVSEIYGSNWAKIERENPDIQWPLKAGDIVTIYNFDKTWLAEQKKRIAPEVYAARFEAARGVNPYTVFPSWSDKVFVDLEEKYTKYDDTLPVYIGIDTGGTYAVVAVQFKQREDNTNTLTKGYDLCVIDELYYQHTVTSAEVYNTCSAREWWPGLNRKAHSWWPVMQGAIDATSNEQQLVWQHEGRKDKVIQGLNLSSRKGSINAGIETVQHFLDTKSIWVNPKCMFFRLEMRKYQNRAPSYSQVGISDPRKQDTPVNAWNHLIKALTYLIVCKFGYYGQTNSNTMITRDRINELWAIRAAEDNEKNKRKSGAMLSRYN